MRDEKGITLISLVVTIILLLILSAITIGMLTGENGVLNEATKANVATSEADVKEKIQLEMLGSCNIDGTVNFTELKNNLEKNLGVTNITESVGVKLQFELDGYEIEVNIDGVITVTEK